MCEADLQQLFIGILRAELTETEPSQNLIDCIDAYSISKLFVMAKKHDLVHIVSVYLDRVGLLKEDEISKEFRKKAITSVYRIEYMKYAFQQVCEIFNKNKIDYVPLKGSVLRNYYPKEDMRTSCDIDILIKENYVDAAVDALVKSGGFILKGKSYHDVSLYSKTNVHLELHFNLLENMDNLDCVLKDAWNYTKQEDGYQHSFTDNFFIYYIFAHMAYHFASGGCGMRSMMDLWVIQNKMGISFKSATDLLKKANIYTFAEKISNLSNICFADGKPDEYTTQLLSYIISGGVFGNIENKVKYAKTNNKSTLRYILKRIFVPFDWMKRKYKVLNKHPYLLPIFYVVRVIEALFLNNTEKIACEVKVTKSTKADDIKDISILRDYLNI